MVTPTGLYPKHFVGFLNILGAPPDREAIAKAVRSWNADDLDGEVVADAGMVMGIHRTQEEWLAHPQGQYPGGCRLSRSSRSQRASPSLTAMIPASHCPGSEPFHAATSSPARPPRARSPNMEPKCCTSRATSPTSTKGSS